MIQRAERNYYLEIFINLFTRSSDKDTESEMQWYGHNHQFYWTSYTETEISNISKIHHIDAWKNLEHIPN